MTVFAIAALVLAFGHIAEEVIEGDATKFDQTILLFFRSVNDLSDPIGPPWVEEMARDITALGSYAVLERRRMRGDHLSAYGRSTGGSLLDFGSGRRRAFAE